MQIKFLVSREQTGEGYREIDIQTEGDGRIGSRFTLRIEKPTAKRIERDYENLYQFVSKPGVLRFMIESAEPAPSPNGIEMAPNQLTLTESGLQFIEKWMSVSKDSSE